jgi:hypothetical protein
VSSPQRRARFRKVAQSKYGGKDDTASDRLAGLMVVRDVRTRWNYTQSMIERGLEMRQVNFFLDSNSLSPTNHLYL